MNRRPEPAFVVVKLKDIIDSIKSTYKTFKSIMNELEKG